MVLTTPNVCAKRKRENVLGQTIIISSKLKGPAEIEMGIIVLTITRKFNFYQHPW